MQVAANAGLAAFGVDYSAAGNYWIFAVVTVVIGLLFVIPALKGQALMAKISKILVPLRCVLFLRMRSTEYFRIWEASVPGP